MLHEISEEIAVDELSQSKWPVLAKDRWEALRKRMAEELGGGLGLGRFATETGVSVGNLQIWLSTPPSIFPSPNARMGEKCPQILVAEKLEISFAQLDEERRQKKRQPVRVETNVTRAVMEGIASARSLVETVLIDAAPGLGKTEGFREYIARAQKAESFNCPVWLIELDEYSLSQTAILGQIARQCGGIGKADEKSEYSLSRAIIEATEGKGGVLIIDEAQHLGDATKKMGMPIINGLRRLVDQGCFGLALIGNGEIYRRLEAGGYHQLMSRMETWRVDIAGLGQGRSDQPALLEEDIDAVMAAWGVSGLAERKYCIETAKQDGALRKLTSVFRHSLERYALIDAGTLQKIKKLTYGKSKTKRG